MKESTIKSGQYLATRQVLRRDPLAKRDYKDFYPSPNQRRKSDKGRRVPGPYVIPLKRKRHKLVS